MAVSRRTVLNRKALTALAEGFVEGMAAMGAAVIAVAHPPDQDPTGQGLITTGDWGVWAGTKKVAGTATKPRSAKLSKTGGIMLVAGYDFPGRFQELGTIHQPARPFLTPAMLQVIPGAEDFIRPAVVKRLKAIA